MKHDLAKQSSMSRLGHKLKKFVLQNGFLLEQIQKLMTKLQVRSHDFVVRDVFLGPPIFLHVPCFAFCNKHAPRDNP